MSGDTGEIYEGQVPTIEPQISGDFETIMKWADETRRLKQMLKLQKMLNKPEILEQKVLV